MTVVLAALLATSAVAATDPADEVRQAETAFAKAFADRDSAKFFAFVLDDAQFLSPRGTLKGKAEVTKAWSRFFESKEAPFSWCPERVAANAGATIGLSSGPVFDAAGTQIAVYSSVWVKQADGSWKIEFDGPGCPAPCPAASEKK